MFLRGKLCQNGQKKISSICYSFLLCLLSFCFALCSSYAKAYAVAPNSYQVYFNIYGYNNNQYFWSPEYNEDETFSVWKMSRYQWKINSIAYSGNYATIHFETNLVFPNANTTNYGGFDRSGLDSLYIRFCGTGGQNGRIISQSVSHTRTLWWTSSDVYNITETIYGDAVVSGMQYTSGSHDLYCGVATQTDEPIFSAPASYTGSLYFEQSPTSVTFTTNESDAIARSQVNSLNNINNSITYLDDNEQQRWETERQEQANKEQELENSSGDLSLSAQTPSVPFFRWFFNPWSSGSRCQTLTYLPRLFYSFSSSAPSWTICSPVPDYLWSPFTLISNFFFGAIILRLYLKKLKGGRDG